MPFERIDIDEEEVTFPLAYIRGDGYLAEVHDYGQHCTGYVYLGGHIRYVITCDSAQWEYSRRKRDGITHITIGREGDSDYLAHCKSIIEQLIGGDEPNHG